MTFNGGPQDKENEQMIVVVVVVQPATHNNYLQISLMNNSCEELLKEKYYMNVSSRNWTLDVFIIAKTRNIHK